MIDPANDGFPVVPTDPAALRLEIKRVIVATLESDIDPATVADDAVLMGDGSTLILDSLDGLQAAVAVSKRFGVRIRDGNHARRVMRSVDTLAEFIAPAR